MGEPHVITALIAKRGELSGQLLDLEREKTTIRAQIGHVDQTLAIFGYAGLPDDIRPRRRQVRRFKRNELQRLLRKIEVEGGVPSRDIALRIMASKGWDAEDRRLIAKVTESVKSAKKLRNKRLREA